MSLIKGDALLFWSYELLSGLVPFSIMLFLFQRSCRTRGGTIGAASTCWLSLFAVYIIGVYHFTGAGTLFEGLRYQWQPPNAFNLIPFSHGIDPAGYPLNIVLFLPFGSLVPFIWDKVRHFRSVLSIGLLFSLLIEVTQLLNIRATDVDDLIMNAIGTAAGYAAYRLFDKATKACFRRSGPPAATLPLCILVLYLGRFFLYNDMGLAKLLYGF